MATATVALFNAAYLVPGTTSMNAGAREQLAGAVYALSQQFANGATAGAAQTAVMNKRVSRILARAALAASPLAGGSQTLVADFASIAGP